MTTEHNACAKVVVVYVIVMLNCHLILRPKQESAMGWENSHANYEKANQIQRLSSTHMLTDFTAGTETGCAKEAIYPGCGKFNERGRLNSFRVRVKGRQMRGKGRSVPYMLTLDELAQTDDIAPVVVEDAGGGESITASPPSFLVVALDGLGHRIVDDVAHVRLVDAHPKGDRRAHNLPMWGGRDERKQINNNAAKRYAKS